MGGRDHRRQANDGYGIAGISWTDEILPVKIMDGEGTGSTADLLSGFGGPPIWRDVINMSVGGFPYSQKIQDAINYALNTGACSSPLPGTTRATKCSTRRASPT